VSVPGNVNERVLPGTGLTDVRPSKGRRRLDQIFSVITASLSIIEKKLFKTYRLSFR